MDSIFWITDWKSFFNLIPAEAIEYFTKTS